MTCVSVRKAYACAYRAEPRARARTSHGPTACTCTQHQGQYRPYTQRTAACSKPRAGRSLVMISPAHSRTTAMHGRGIPRRAPEEVGQGTGVPSTGVLRPVPAKVWGLSGRELPHVRSLMLPRDLLSKSARLLNSLWRNKEL